MFTIQFVNLVPAHDRCPHDSLIHQPRQTPTDTDLRTTDGPLSYLTDGQRPPGHSEHG